MKQEIKYKTTNKFSPDVINEIVEVKDTQGLTAENLLEKAKEEDSSLHNFFEWNNSKAGEMYRIYQARLLINEVKIVIGDKEIFAFENITTAILNNEDILPNREYKSIPEIMSNPDSRKILVDRALGEIEYWEERYKELQELKIIFTSINKFKEKWKKKQK